MNNDQRIKLLTQAYQADMSARELIAMVIADLEHERQGPILEEAKPRNFTEASAAVAPREVISKPKLQDLAKKFIGKKTPTVPANNLTLQTLNYAGFPLAQCLRGMLKKWEDNTPGWPISEGIHRQAKTYNVHFNDICSAISTNKQLHNAFMRWPETGYPEWAVQNDHGID